MGRRERSESAIVAITSLLAILITSILCNSMDWISLFERNVRRTGFTVVFPTERWGDLGHLDSHLADLVLNGSVARMLPKLAEVRIAGEPLEIAIPESEGLFQRTRGGLKFGI